MGIRTTAGEVLLQLFDLRIIERWGSGANLMVTFWNLSSDVIISIARQLMELKCADEKTRFLLELLQQLMSRRNIFLKDHQVTFAFLFSAVERVSREGTTFVC